MPMVDKEALEIREPEQVDIKTIRCLVFVIVWQDPSCRSLELESVPPSRFMKDTRENNVPRSRI